jgi:hypothetical protein
MTNAPAPILTVELRPCDLGRCIGLCPYGMPVVEPIRPVGRRQGDRGPLDNWRIFEIPLIEGAVFERRRVLSPLAEYAVVRDGRLHDVPLGTPDLYDALQALIDPSPDGIEARRQWRLAQAVGLPRFHTFKRFDFDRGHGIEAGAFHEFPNGALAFAKRATREQAWLRQATPEEYAAHHAQQAKEARSPTP